MNQQSEELAAKLSHSFEGNIWWSVRKLCEYNQRITWDGARAAIDALRKSIRHDREAIFLGHVYTEPSKGRIPGELRYIETEDYWLNRKALDVLLKALDIQELSEPEQTEFRDMTLDPEEPVISELQTWSNDQMGVHIRTGLLDNGEPYWVAKDVAEALDYTWKGISGTIPHMPDMWKGVRSIQTPSGTQEMAILTEQGLYFFLNRSDKPKAIPFQMWVNGEVLPAIRKTGKYAVPSDNVPRSFPEALRLAADQAEKIEQQQKQLTQQAPLVSYMNDHARTDESCTFDDFARKEVIPGCPISIKVFREWMLNTSGFMNKRRSQQLAKAQPHKPYIDAGLFKCVHNITRDTVTTLIKPENSQYFHWEITAAGYPVIKAAWMKYVREHRNVIKKAKSTRVNTSAIEAGWSK